MQLATQADDLIRSTLKLIALSPKTELLPAAAPRMADDKDPREEALWEYANEKVRHETGPARHLSPQAALRAVLPLLPLSVGAHPPFRPAPLTVPLRCATAARHAAADDLQI